MKKSRKYINRFHIVLIVIIVLTGIFLRLDNISDNMTNVDDIMVAQFIVDYKYDFTERNDIFDELKPYYNYTIAKVGRMIFTENDLMKIQELLDQNPLRFLKVAISSTYAPGQFMITQFLLDNDQDYDEALFFGRLPSFIFGVMLFFALIFLNIRIQDNKYIMPVSALGLSIEVFSWAHIINSNTMHNISVGVFSLAVIMILLNYYEKVKITYFSAIFLSILLFILCMFQYFLVIFVPAVFITLLFKNYNKLNKVFIRLLIAGFIFAVLFSPFFYLKLIDTVSVHWNAGENNEFVNELDEPLSWPGFYIKNTYIQFMNLASFDHDDNLIFFMLSILLFSFSLLGSFLLIYNKKSRFIGIFIIFSLLTYLGLTFVGKLPLAPTRHFLIFLPFIAILVPEGVKILSKMISYRYYLVINVLLIILIALVFFVSYEENIEERNDLFDENEIQNLLKENEVTYFIVDFGTLNIFLMPEIENDYEYVFNNKKDYWISKQTNEKKNIAFISNTKYDMSSIVDVFDLRGIDLSSYEINEKIEKERSGRDEFSSSVKRNNNQIQIIIFKK